MLQYNQNDVFVILCVVSGQIIKSPSFYTLRAQQMIFLLREKKLRNKEQCFSSLWAVDNAAISSMLIFPVCWIPLSALIPLFPVSCKCITEYPAKLPLHCELYTTDYQQCFSSWRVIPRNNCCLYLSCEVHTVLRNYQICLLLKYWRFYHIQTVFFSIKVFVTTPSSGIKAQFSTPPCGLFVTCRGK